MTTTTPETSTLRAVTDKLCTKIHLGSAERKNVTFCRVKLITTEGEGHYTATDDLATVSCGACKRTAVYKAATDGAGTASGAAVIAAAGQPGETGQFDAAVLSVIRSYAPGEARDLKEIQGAIEPKPALPRLRQSVTRLVKAGTVSKDGDRYAAVPQMDGSYDHDAAVASE